MDSSDVHSRGGKARADALTPERRAEIARAGAAARWAKPNASLDAAIGTLRRRSAELLVAMAASQRAHRGLSKAMERHNEALAAVQKLSAE